MSHEALIDAWIARRSADPRHGREVIGTVEG
jgi:hypothetical protein